MSREYLIEILRRQRQQQNRQKTMVLPSRRYEPLGRRRLGTATFRFFDCASEIQDDLTYADVPFRIETEIIINDIDQGIANASLSDYATRDTTLFGSSKDPDIDRFYEFKPDAVALDRRTVTLETSHGSYAINQANAETDYADRWVIPKTYTSATDIKIQGNSSSCETLYLKGSQRLLNKITLEYDYNAPDTYFSVSGDMEVYLMPTLIAQFPQVNYQVSTTPSIGAVVIANMFFSWWDRYHFIERPEIYCPDGGFTPPDLWTGPAIGFGNIYLNPWDTAGYLAAYPGFDVFKHYDGARAVIRHADNSYTITTIDAFLNPTQFPVPPSVPTTTALTPNDPTRMELNGYPRQTPSTGSLTGIIRKGEKLYYFWQN